MNQRCVPIRVLLGTLLVAWLVPDGVHAAGGGGDWTTELWDNVWDPWFVFGMGAQGVFFLRFIVQWIASEKRQRSTIPVVFWHLSIAGAVATFIYAIHEAQPVFMLGQALACAIYVRNLMLIYGRSARLKRAGLPPAKARAALDGEYDDPDAP